MCFSYIVPAFEAIKRDVSIFLGGEVPYSVQYIQIGDYS